ncbi:hypothetical protein [Tabrizicola soli]|uniref:Uncharacterized protein n=1 Tax=Tabrizicola soli TaxID=2185115 RepID=A0ABV7E078_9RHOB|nr:hypothetical protein [Tabrizicola soli]
MRKIYFASYYVSDDAGDDRTQNVAMTRDEVEAVLRKRAKKAEKKARKAQQELDAFLALEGGAA